jgi:hypothetical protein
LHHGNLDAFAKSKFTDFYAALVGGMANGPTLSRKTEHSLSLMVPGHTRTGVVMQQGISRKYCEALSVRLPQQWEFFNISISSLLMYRTVEMAFPIQGWVGLTFLRTGKGPVFSMHVFSFSHGLKVSTSTTIRRKLASSAAS